MRLAASSWGVPVLLYLAVRALGIIVLTVFTAEHGMTLETALTKWDGLWMLAIAQGGYANIPDSFVDGFGVHTDTTAYAFFPGYPAAVAAVSSAFGVSAYAAALGLNVVFGAVAAVGAARLGELCAPRITPSGEPRQTGLILVALFAATPMSIVLSMAYTEALFCALAVWALVGVLRRNWLLAGVCALVIGTVRPNGVAVIAVVMVAAALAHRDGPRAWLAVALAPLGYLGYLGYVGRQAGSPLAFFRIQSDGWDTRFDGGQATRGFIARSLLDSETFATLMSVAVILATIGLLLWSIRARLPWPVLLYAALLMASVLLSSGLMISRPRLLLPVFVLLVPAAGWLSHRKPATIIGVLVSVSLVSAWIGAHMLTVFPHAI